VTRTLSRRLGVLVITALVAGGVAVSAGDAAQGYPPGTGLHLVANRPSVAVTQKVTLSVFHAGPGCRVKFTFGTQHAFRSTSKGKAAATFTSTATSGTIHAKAATYRCAYLEHAFTTVRASSPAIKLPAHVVKRHSFRVTIYRFPADTTISVRVYNASFSKTRLVTTGGAGTSKPTFTVPSAGSYVVVASGAGAFASTVLHARSR
jgi:hypothetical protein